MWVELDACQRNMSFYTPADAAIASANLKKNSDIHTQNALKRLGPALDRFLYARNAATAPPPSSSSPHPQSNSNNGSSSPLHVGTKRSIDNIRDNDKDDNSNTKRSNNANAAATINNNSMNETDNNNDNSFGGGTDEDM